MTTLAVRSSTAAVAATAFAVGMLMPQTISQSGSGVIVRTPVRSTTALPTNDRKTSKIGATTTTFVGDFASAYQEYFLSAPARETSPTEMVVGELRRWAEFSSNWDGEGASAPVLSSLDDASDFVRLLSSSVPDADPMLNADGRAGLYWNNNGLYADIEFLGDGRIAYFVQRNEDRHKGTLHFDGESVPPVLAALLAFQPTA